MVNELDNLEQALEVLVRPLGPAAADASAKRIANDVLAEANIQSDPSLQSVERQHQLFDILDSFSFLQDIEAGQNDGRGRCVTIAFNGLKPPTVRRVRYPSSPEIGQRSCLTPRISDTAVRRRISQTPSSVGQAPERGLRLYLVGP